MLFHFTVHVPVDRGPTICGNCRCMGCLGPPCLSPLSRPPFCNGCEFRHGPTHTQCSLSSLTANDDDTVITEPFAADDIEVAVNELSPRSTQSISRATTSPMINALTNATVAAAVASVEEDTQKCPHQEELPGANQPDLIWQLPSKASYR